MKGVNMNRKSYPGNLTDAQWEKLLSFVPTPRPLGSPLKWKMRPIINAIFHGVNSGCQRRMLPHDMPPRQTVYYHFSKREADGICKHVIVQDDTDLVCGSLPSSSRQD